MIGTTIDCYKLLEEIGSGGFATVYLGLDTRVNEPVAVKVLTNPSARNARAIERLQHEAQALMKLPPHPNIVGLRDSGKVDGYYYLVMDYASGSDLSAVLDERLRLPVSEAVDVAVQVARALSVVEGVGIVHRDIKPENIRLLPDGTVKVMDFGIARDAAVAHLTQPGLLAGTTKYVAPEIWKGQQPNKYSDIYALGCVVYEMLLGNPPFLGATPESIMLAHIQTPPDVNKLADIDVPTGLCDLIEQMLAKSPAERPCADELVRDLPKYGRVGGGRLSTLPARAAGTANSKQDDPDDKTRVNLAMGKSGRKARQSRRGWVSAFAMAVSLLLGLGLGAAGVATLGLSLVLDTRARQLDPTSAAAAQNISNLFRGTPLPTPRLITTALSEMVAITPTPSVTPAVTTAPVSVYARVPGRSRMLANGRRMDWFIDNDMNGMVLDPPIDTELGRKYWTKLDYTDDADYGAGYLTVQAGESVNVRWSMDVPLPAGLYEIFVYRPRYLRDFVAESVLYRVWEDNKEVQPFAGTGYVNQQATRGMWVSIGGYTISRPALLSVTLDVEAARPIAYEVDVDAIGIVRLGEKKLSSQ